MAKLKDVAQLAGVSIAAVSLYVNGKSKGRISRETQRKIEQALADTGYEPPSHEEKEEVTSTHTSTKTVLIFWCELRGGIGTSREGEQVAVLPHVIGPEVEG